MNKFRFTIRILAIAIFTFAVASMAQAQASRTWVSGVGDDANPCSRTAPCKTFAGAISKTAACGEINVLDPGGYGAVTITKSITIDGTGTFASILASLVTGITINAASTDVITIRGISIDGFCNGLRAMNILQAKTVNIEDCVMFRFAGPGIRVAETSDLQLNVRNTVIRDNTGAGIDATTSGGQIRASLVHSSFNGNLHGLHAKGNTRITADHCAFNGNTQNGVFAEGVGGVGVANISNSQIVNNGTNGVHALTGGSVARINNCDIIQNSGSGALVGAGGQVDTWGNNRITGNGTNGCVSCSPIGFN
jgi:Right handed beta helix region